MSKVTILGGGGIRTPLLIHGLVRAPLGLEEIALYDIDLERAGMMAALGREVARQAGVEVSITTPAAVEEAVTGAEFVVSSLRVGGAAARARDERIAIEHGIAGQETTGLGGLSKALRTIPVMLEHARAVERYAPAAWFISFTNPAGLMTQALSSLTRLKLIGICDTPSEMFHRLAEGMGRPVDQVGCDYFGLNHLGWIREVRVDGENRLPAILGDEALVAAWKAQIESAQATYVALVDQLMARYQWVDDKVHRRKMAREAARGVLPNSTETKIVVTGNARAWRTMLELRSSEAAEFEIRRMAIATLRVLQREAPAFFSDFEIYVAADRVEAARIVYHKV